jgi:hypothetical protein
MVSGRVKGRRSLHLYPCLGSAEGQVEAWDVPQRVGGVGLSGSVWSFGGCNLSRTPPSNNSAGTARDPRENAPSGGSHACFVRSKWGHALPMRLFDSEITPGQHGLLVTKGQIFSRSPEKDECLGDLDPNLPV